MSQLRIHSINDLHFGKHQGASFKDLNHDFVVFYGLNESGKSTIAEYLTWAIGGPWRSGKEGSERFRSLTNDQVSGRLVGTLDEEIIDIDAKSVGWKRTWDSLCSECSSSGQVCIVNTASFIPIH